MMQHYPSVAVVVLSWNGKKFLERFLPPLLTTTYPNASLYVADNASTDDSVKFASDNFPGIKIIRIEKNCGFAEGYNIALKQVEADYCVLLNQDVEVTPGWIEPVIGLMERDRHIAACQPKIRSYSNKQIFEYAGAAGGFLDKYGYSFCRGRFFNVTEIDAGQYDASSEIVWATGACMFLRSKLYHEMGGLDGDFFAYFEEIDLCWRLKNAGYSIRYCPDSAVFHVGSGSLSRGNPKITFLNYRNNMSALVKNLPEKKLFATLFIRFCLDIISAYKSLFTGNWRDYLAIAKAHVYFVSHFKKLLAKRKEVWTIIALNKISSPNRKGFYKRSIIVDYFIKRIHNFSGLPVEKFE